MTRPLALFDQLMWTHLDELGCVTADPAAVVPHLREFARSRDLPTDDGRLEAIVADWQNHRRRLEAAA